MGIFMNILFYYYCSIHTILLLLLLFYCYYINYVCLINILAKIQLLIISLDFGQLLTMFSDIAVNGHFMNILFYYYYSIYTILYYSIVVI